jgi:hypothetical protein
MHCEYCGRPAAPGYGTTCRYCGGPIVSDDPRMAYGAPNPHQNPYQNPNQPRARAKQSRGGGFLRGALSVGAIILTIAIIVFIRVGARLLGDKLTNSSDTTTNSAVTSAHTFNDPLTSNANGWPGGSGLAFKSDGYHITQNLLAYAPIDPATSADITVHVVQTSGDVTSPYGIVFRRTSKGNYYAFGIDSNGKWAFFKAVEGALTDVVPATANSAITTGLNSTNTLEVKDTGSHFVFFVNSTQVGMADDSSLTGKGANGVFGADNIEVVFSQFSLTRLD